MKTIMFLRNVNASWAVRDAQILSEKHQVIDNFVNKKFYFNPKWVFDTIKSDIVFLWFASFAFYPVLILAKLLNKKIILVSGGFDAAYAPSINYGAFTKSPLNQWFRRKMFALADKILCVSKSNMQETIINAKADSKKCEVIYHGFEPSIPLHEIKEWDQRKNQVLMISNGALNTFYLKGIDQFLKLAEILPEYDFVLMGRLDESTQDYFNRYATKNVRTTGFISFNSKEFCEILNDSKFILQLSYYESFGCSVIDGAIAGCYPIVYDQFALGELISKNLGIKVNYGSIDQLKIAVEKLDYFDTKESSSCYLNLFNYEARKTKLNSVVEI